MRIDDYIYGVWKKRYLGRIWVAFFILTAIALVVFCIPGEEVDSRLHRRDPEYNTENAVETQNAVTIFNPSSKEYETALVNTILMPGSRVKTSSIGTGEIRLIDGSIVRLSNKTEVLIQSIHTNPWQGIRVARFHTFYGETYVDTGGSGNIFIFTKDTSETVIEGRAVMTENSVIPLDEDSNVSIRTAAGNHKIPYGKKMELTDTGEFVTKIIDPSNYASKTKQEDAPTLELDSDNIVTINKDIAITGKSDPGVKVSIRDFSSQTNLDGSFEVVFVDHPIGSNKYTLTATDSAGRSSDIGISITRTPEKNHILEIQNPSDTKPLQTDESKVIIEGSVKGSSSLMINGVEVEHTDDKFSYEVKLDLGQNVIEIISTSSEGGQIEKKITIERVSELPTATIKITHPASSRTVTTDGTTVINGTANTESVYYNSKAIKVTDGAFSFVISLEYGVNTIAVEANDKNHKPSSVDIVVERKRNIEKSLYIGKTPALVNKAVVNISGNTSGADKLTISGADATIKPDGSFTQDVALKAEGENTIDIVVTYFDGTTYNESIRVTRDTTPPDLSGIKAIKNPDGGVTIQGEIKEKVTFLSINGLDVTEQVVYRTNEQISSVLHKLDSIAGNFIEVMATDTAGNTISRNVPIRSN